jgi:anti-sigma B factor antagonist
VEVIRRTVQGATVVAVSGDLDGRSTALAEEITAALRDSSEVVLDLSGVQYLSSAGLRVMLIVYRQAQCLGTKVAVVGLSEELRMVMHATGFLAFFLVADSPVLAIRHLRGEDQAGPAGSPVDREGW